MTNSNTPRPTPKPTRLLSSVPNRAYERLVVSYPYRRTTDYAYFYEESAKRLAGTFTGQPEDDTILMPFLFLYRQAFELRLKHLISYFAAVRMTYELGPTPALLRLQDDQHLKEKFGHNLYKLLNECKMQFEALSVEWTFPNSVERVVIMFHDDDGSGMAFRYAGQLPNVQEYADFPDLAALLDREYSALSLLEDGVDGVYQAAPTLRELSQ